MPHGPSAAVAAALLVFAAPRAAAQLDYRNLDDDRPVRVEDAFPVERYAFEGIAPYRFARAPGGAMTHAVVLELAWGAVLSGHAGVKLAFVDTEGPAGRTRGIAGGRVFAFYQLFTESPGLPAVALRADAFLPAGSLGGDRVRGELKLIATRSFGRNRLHVNGAVGLGPDGSPPAAEGASRWWAGAALDRTLIRQSLLLVAEAHVVRDARGDPLEVNAGVGARWQWTPTLVLDLGVSRRLRANGPDVALTFGVSKAFAIAALMPSGPAPRPTGGDDAHRH